MADQALPEDACPSRATPAEHIYGWSQSASDAGTGVEMEIRYCMMCGKAQVRVRQPRITSDDWGPWLDVK